VSELDTVDEIAIFSNWQAPELVLSWKTSESPILANKFGYKYDSNGAYAAFSSAIKDKNLRHLKDWCMGKSNLEDRAPAEHLGFLFRNTSHLRFRKRSD
jgi:peptide methionine sulfoxide reductase MsrB